MDTIGKAGVRVAPDTKGLRKQLEATLKAIEKALKVSIALDVSLNQASITQARTQLEKLAHGVSATVDVNIDDTAAVERLAALTNDRRVDVTVDVDAARAAARLDAMARDRRANLTVDVDKSAASHVSAITSSLGSMGKAASLAGVRMGGVVAGATALAGMLPQIAAIVSTATSALPVLAAAPAALAVMGTSLAGIVVAVPAITAQLKPLKAGWQSVAGTIRSSVTRELSGARGATASLAQMMSGWATSASSQAAGLGSAIGSMVSSIVAALNSGGIRQAIAAAMGGATQSMRDFTVGLSAIAAQVPAMISQLANPKVVAAVTTPIKEAMVSLSASMAGVDWAGVVTGAVGALSQLGGVISSVASIAQGLFGPMAAAGLTQFQAFSAGLSTVASAINSAFAQNALESFFTSAQHGLAAIMPALGALATNIIDMLPSLGLLGSALLSALGPALTAAVNALGPALTSVALALAPLISQMGPILQQFAAQAAPLFAELATGVIPVLVSAVSQLLPPIAQIVSSLLPPLMTIMQQMIPAFTQIVQTVLPPIVSLIQQLVPVIAQIAAVLGPVIAQVISQVVPPMTQLIQTVLPPLVAIIMQLVHAVLPPILEILPTIAQAFIAILVPAINLATGIIQALMPVVQYVFSYISSLISAAMQIIQGIITTVTGVISNDWSQVWEGIKQIFSGVWNAIKTVVSTYINIVKSVISAGLSVVSRIVSSAWGKVKSIFSNAWSSLKSTVSNGVNAVKDTVAGIPGKITAALGNLGNLLKGSGEALINGFVSGIKNMASKAANAAKDVVNKVRDFFPFSPAKEGPFSGRGYTTYSGAALMRGFASGITSSAAAPLSAVDRVMSTLTGRLATPVGYPSAALAAPSTPGNPTWGGLDLSGLRVVLEVPGLGPAVDAKIVAAHTATARNIARSRA